MSVEHLKEYGKLIAEHEEIKNKAKEIGFDVEGQIAYGKELGFDFDVDDMQALAEEVGFSEDELSEEQLEQIAGGAITLTAAVMGQLLMGILIGGAMGIVIGGAAAGAGGAAAVAGFLEAAKW